MAVWDAKPRIAVCIPHMETVTVKWATEMMVPLFYVGLDWCEKIYKMTRGIPQNLARDQLVEMAFEDKAVTHILFVDSDNVCQYPKDPNIALRMLYNCNQPIVSGLYRAKQAQGFNYAAWVDIHRVDPNLPTDKLGFAPIGSYTGSLFTVDVIGMGFCLVKREVYEHMPKPWHRWDKPTPSEDFNFCLDAKKAGFLTWVMADVKLDHIGQLNVHADGTITTLDV
jgi:hypothetical protein